MGMLMEPTIDSLVARCKAGDQQAFEELVSRHGLLVLRTARLIVRDDALAEDVFQETFVSAWRQIRSLRGDDVEPWLLRIAINKSISFWRRRHRLQALMEHLPVVSRPSFSPSSDQRIDLARALSRLPAGWRAAVLLHYYHDLTVEATARALGVRADTAKSWLKAALQRLRRLTGLEEVSQ
jgi:RNA polymerase sigma-70 factor, ECF subfamily